MKDITVAIIGSRFMGGAHAEPILTRHREQRWVSLQE